MKPDAINAYRSGRATLRELAQVLGLDTWATHELLQFEGVEIGRGGRSETGAALGAVLDAADAGPS